MDLENNEDFDLEDILKEFGDHPESGKPSEPAGQMPELRFDDEAAETEPEEPAVSDTPEIDPVEAVLAGTPEMDPVEAVLADTPEMDPVEAILADTQNFGTLQEPEVPEATDEPTIVVDLSGELPGEDSQPSVAEPAFEVEEEFIPAPIVFTPRSRLKELKKQLVAGPERRYYELSEMGVGRMQAALLLNLLVVLICAGVTAMFALGMVPENRMKLVIFSQVLAMLVSALLGSNLMLDSLGDLLKGRFTVNTLLTLTFAACLIDSVFCLQELRVPCCAAFSLEMTMALWARLQKHNTEMAQMDTMRKAVRLHGIVRVENYYAGKDGLLRKEGEVSDFM